MAFSNEYFDDFAASYDRDLAAGLRLSGEGKQYFQKGRLRALRRSLSDDMTVRRILDFGCGLGDTSTALANLFPSARVVGLDSARRMVEHARRINQSPRVSFSLLSDLSVRPGFDLCYVNGVFHHIPPAERLEAASLLYRSLRPGGVLAFFENNPLNPGTRWVMRRIPFDREALPMTPYAARRLLRQAGFEPVGPSRFLFFYPRPLRFLRFSEPWLVRLPLGGQYLVLARNSQQTREV